MLRPYYGNCVQQKCNRPDEALFKKKSQRYFGKLIVQLSVRTPLATVRTPLRKIVSDSVYCMNLVLNFVVLREFILGVVVLILLLSSRCQVPLLCLCEVYLKEEP
jgi:hypothetical protein